VNVAGLILAAGASRRMGGPKALLEYRGQTFLEGLAARFAAACSSITIVLGYHADAIRSTVDLDRRTKIVVNPAPERGMLSSWKCGLASLSGADAVLVSPVDYPAITCETVVAVVAAIESGDFAVPRHQGRHGHPIGFRAELIPEFLSLPENAKARDVVHRYVATTVYVDVNDAGTLHDVDDPSSYKALLESP
jgi:CTP:molybdopterin cytidylyltransferase MocA